MKRWNLTTFSDPPAERAVIAGLLKHGSEAFYDVDSIINENTFTIDANQFIYKCLQHICKKSSIVYIDIPSIYSAAHELGLDTFFNRKEEMAHLSAVSKFPVHLNNIRRFATKIRKLEITRLMYDTLEQTKDKYLEIQGDEPISHILGIAEESIFDFTSLLNDNEDVPVKMFTGIKERLDDLTNNIHEQVGISTGFSRYDFAIGGGLRPGTVNVIGARPKALAENEIVYTLSGPIKVQDIKVGDEILHPFNRTTKVTEVYEFLNEDIYEISFRDGDTIRACKDHRWEVYKRFPYGRIKDKIPEIKTTQELIKDLRIGNQEEYKWDVRLPNPTTFIGKEVELDPYTLGLLLGDGSFRNAITFSTGDTELSNYLFLNLKNEIKLEIDTETCKTYRINGLQQTIRNLGLYKKKAKDKFIPKDYLYNSIGVRLAILRGLMDTDGDCTVDKRSGNSRCRFSSISKQLALDVKEIVNSLGGLCSINLAKGQYKNQQHLSYRCEIRMKFNPFCLKRKSNKFKGRRIGELKRSISDIKKISKGKAYCYKVDAQDELFLTTNFLITKNTGKTLLSDNIGLYISKKLRVPVLNLDTEMRIEDHQDRSLAILTGVGISDIETGKFSRQPVKSEKIKNILKENLETIPYHYRNIGGKPFEDQLSIMRRWVAREVGLTDAGKAKPCVIIYDYVKLMSSDGITRDISEFQALGFLMTSLHNFAIRYDVPILAFVQLNRDGITKESTDAASGSDRIVWLCSNFTIYKTKSDEEIAKDGPDNGNRKLVPIIARHGEGLQSGDYINVHMKGYCGQIEEGSTAFELQDKVDNKTYDNVDVPFAD